MSPLIRVPTASTLLLTVAVASLCLVSYVVLIISRRPKIGDRAPKLTEGGGRLLWGSGFEFFSHRWDFHNNASKKSETGNYSFYLGPHPMIGLSGAENRKTFFEHKGLAFSEAYDVLFGGGGDLRADVLKNAGAGENEPTGSEFGKWFLSRLATMLKGGQIRKTMPKLLNDIRSDLDTLAAKPFGIMDPFHDIYHVVFHMTMRAVASNEIADNPKLLDRCLGYFEEIEESTSALGVMYKWLPLPSKAKRTIAGAKMYKLFSDVVADRKKHNRREDDALQHLMDEGDKLQDIITFVLGSLFAGQVNSGINAAYILCWLGRDKHWHNEVTKEVFAVADKYAPDTSQPLRDRLMSLPTEAWESEFPIIDLCLKESIRLNLPGAQLRQNLSGHDIPIHSKSGKNEVIPHGAFVAYAVGDTFYNDDIFKNPEQWDPSRYQEPRCEDKKEKYAWMGWGAGRHPCAGMRFAKLEMSMIVAFFVAYFDDFVVCDESGKETTYIPMPSRNNLHAAKPKEKIWIKYSVRK